MRNRTTPCMSARDAARFAAKHTTGGGCWLWQASGPNGYGAMSVGGKAYPAHRLSYAYHRGPIPRGMHVLHSCDIRACVNPEHLRIGSAKDNCDDKTSRGRWGGPVKGMPKGSPARRAPVLKALVIRCRVEDLERWHAAAAIEGAGLSELARDLLDEWAEQTIAAALD